MNVLWTCFILYISHIASSICTSSFDLHLQNYGVDTDTLSAPVSSRVFRAWLEDWEEEILKKNDCVAEARLLEKYKDLVFFDPDTQVNFTVHGDNLEFRRGKDGGWNLIGNSSDDGVEDEGFAIGEMIIDMIADTQQGPAVEIIRMNIEAEEDTALEDNSWEPEEAAC